MTALAGKPDFVSALARSYLFEGIPASDLEPLARAASVLRLERVEPLWQIRPTSCGSS